MNWMSLILSVRGVYEWGLGQNYIYLCLCVPPELLVLGIEGIYV